MDTDRFNRRVFGYWWRALLWQATVYLLRRPRFGHHRHPLHHWYH